MTRIEQIFIAAIPCVVALVAFWEPVSSIIRLNSIQSGSNWDTTNNYLFIAIGIVVLIVLFAFARKGRRWSRTLILFLSE